MRSKEADDAIDNFKFFNEGEYITREMAESKDTVLNYISELEKENAKYKNFQLHINGMRNGKELLIKYINDSVLKEDIRDKIKVLEGCIEEFKPQGYIEGELKAKIEVLKELLEGE